MKRLLTIILIGLFAITTSAQWLHPKEVPAYNAVPPARGHKLPFILSGGQLTGASFRHPAQTQSYKIAAKHEHLFHQLPCYCYCDRTAGHNSLHSCFESEHGANCGICMQEAVLAGNMAKQGKTVRQIRASIIRGDYEKTDLRSVKTTD